MRITSATSSLKTSPIVIQKLHDNGLYGLGTVQAWRKHFFSVIISLIKYKQYLLSDKMKN